MRIKQKNNSKRNLLILLVFAVIILGVGLLYYYHQKTSSGDVLKKQIDSIPSEGGSKDQGSGKNSTGNSDEASSQKQTNPLNIESQPSEQSPNASLTVTKLSQSGNTIDLAADVTGVSGDGRCIAYFTSQNNDSVSTYLTVNKASPVTCTASIEAGRFSFLGEWSVKVVYTTSDNKIVEGTSKVNIK